MEFFDLQDVDALIIGDDIKLVIDRCIDDGLSTHLGIDAPKEVLVLREELIKSKNLRG